jgi:hypothetical protein
MSNETKRVRRNEDQLIADLEAKIAQLQRRAAQKKVKRDPALKHISAAVRSIDKAMAETGDAATRTALDEARGTLSACLTLNGATPRMDGKVITSHSRRSVGAVSMDALLEHVRKNPGQRGEHIAEALGTDTKTMRPTMHKLIAEKKIKTRGERRGMTYAAV